MASEISLDLRTLLELQQEASKSYEEVNTIFEEEDCTDAWHVAQG